MSAITHTYIPSLKCTCCNKDQAVANFIMHYNKALIILTVCNTCLDNNVDPTVCRQTCLLCNEQKQFTEFYYNSTGRCFEKKCKKCKYNKYKPQTEEAYVKYRKWNRNYLDKKKALE